MALSASGLKSVLQPLILSKLQEKFPEAAQFSEQASQQQKLSQALAEGIAEALVPYLLSNAQVAPGIAVATAGGPTAQVGATTSPGMLI